MNVPALHGNWVDLVVLGVLFYSLLGGWHKGFFEGIIDLGGLMLSFLFSLKFYSFFGQLIISNFSLPHSIANALGFFIAGFLMQVFLSIIINQLLSEFHPRLSSYIQAKNLSLLVGRLDSTLGLLPAIVEALIFTAFFLTLLITLPVQGSIKRDILDSKLGAPLIAKTQGIESVLNGIFSPALNETISFLTVNPTSKESVNLHFTQKEVAVDATTEDKMLILVNSERTSRGLTALSESDKLRELARNYGKDMFDRGYFSHYNPEGQSPFDRMKADGIEFSAAGENLALAPDLELAHQGLMNSPGHRANILSVDFGRVGIGVIDGGIYGKMFVQEFTN